MPSDPVVVIRAVRSIKHSCHTHNVASLPPIVKRPASIKDRHSMASVAMGVETARLTLAASPDTDDNPT